MILWFDFDGTLVDVRAKYLALYRAFGREQGARTLLSDGQFWALKRAGVSNAEIAVRSGLPAELAGRFGGFVEARVEQEESLRRDELFPAALDVLRQLSSFHTCHLVSMRRDYAMLCRQLEWLGIREHFVQVLEVPRDGAADLTPKAAVIRRHATPGPALIIGDSDMDILTGRQLGIPSCAVSTGIRVRERLIALEPDYIVDSLADIMPVVARFF